MDQSKYNLVYKLYKLFEQVLGDNSGSWSFETLYNTWVDISDPKSVNEINLNNILLMYELGSWFVPKLESEHEPDSGYTPEQITRAGISVIHSINRMYYSLTKIPIPPEYTFDILDYSIRLYICLADDLAHPNKFTVPFDPTIESQELQDNFVHLFRQGREGTSFETKYPIPQEESGIVLDPKLKSLGANLWAELVSRDQDFKYLTIVHQTFTKILKWIAIGYPDHIHMVGYETDSVLLDKSDYKPELTVYWLR